MNIEDHIIPIDSTILEALKALNSIPGGALTLFVVDCDKKLVGTVTDGDIRRQLVNGSSLTEPIIETMNKNFTCIRGKDVRVSLIREYKEKGISLLPRVNENGKIVEIYNLKKNKSVLPIDAVLMAGGKGERLRPLTENCPKPLLKIGNKAIIDYNIERLISYGIKELTVTVNYLREQIEDHFSNTIEGVKVNCIQEPCYLGTIGSVKFVHSFENDTVLVMNSDLFTNIDYEDFYLHFEKHNADISVAVVPYVVNVPYGIFRLDGREIHGIEEKPTYNYYANAGIYLIKRELLDLIPDNEFFNATDFIETLITQKKKVIRFPITGYWIDIGKHEDFKKAQELVKHINI